MWWRSRKLWCNGHAYCPKRLHRPRLGKPLSTKKNDFWKIFKGGKGHLRIKNLYFKFSLLLRLYLTVKRCQNAQTSMLICVYFFRIHARRIYWLCHEGTSLHKVSWSQVTEFRHLLVYTILTDTLTDKQQQAAQLAKVTKKWSEKLSEWSQSEPRVGVGDVHR